MFVIAVPANRLNSTKSLSSNCEIVASLSLDFTSPPNLFQSDLYISSKPSSVELPKAPVILRRAVAT